MPYRVRRIDGGYDLRCILVIRAALLGGLVFPASAQRTVDDGLPPGWQDWARLCGEPGQFNACLNEGKRHFFGVGTAPDKRQAARFLTRACAYSNKDTCSQAATIARDELQALDLYHGVLDTASGQGFATFCREGFGFYASKLVEANYPRAFMTANFDGAKAIAFAERGCRIDDASSCLQLGVAHSPYEPMGLEGIARDPDRSFASFMSACRLGNGNGCWFAFYENTGLEGLPLDEDRRLEALEMGCAEKVEDLCRIGANLFMQAPGAGAAGEKALAVPFLIGGCKDEEEQFRAIMCSNAAALIVESEPADPRVRDLALQACNLRDHSGCIILGNTYLDDDVAASLYWFRQSCRLGFQGSCEWVEEYVEEKRRYEAEMAEYWRRQTEQRRAWEEEVRERRAAARRERRRARSSGPRYSSSSSSTPSYMARSVPYSPPAMPSSSEIYRSVAATSTHNCIYTGGSNCGRF